LNLTQFMLPEGSWFRTSPPFRTAPLARFFLCVAQPYHSRGIMRIIVNSRPLDTRQGQSLLALLVSLDLDPEVVVVERNLDIVPGSAFAATVLQENDKLEIMSFVGGG
jgi:thiamine biosynthesis protein ThiS